MTTRHRVIIVICVAFVALVRGEQRIAATGEAAGSLLVESDPAGASVYVDGRLAGETPLTLPSIAAGEHRVRIVRLGYLENSQIVKVRPTERATLRARLTDPAPQTAKATALKIVVLEGEGAINIIQQKTAVAPVIEVRDRNDQPVSGALVRFAIQKGRASFNGVRTLTATTDALGRATATGLTPTGSGALQIGTTAAFQGQTAAITIAQTNVLTAAQASAAAAGGSGTASGGGGLSHFAIAGIVGGAGAGGVLIASKVSGRCAASAVCGQWSVLFGDPGLQTSACGQQTGPLGLSSQGITVDLSGAFHTVWSTSPPTSAAQVDGTLTPTGLNGTLRCVSTTGTGTITATRSGPDYLGTATLSGVTVSIRAIRFQG